MSNIQEKKSQLVEARGELQVIHSHYGLMKVHRVLLTIVLFLMLLVLVMGFLLFPDQAININNKKNSNPVNAYHTEMSPVLTADINTLKEQMIGLVSGSIESKLRTLEESIRLGTAANALGTIQDLKNDVKVLRTYSQPAEKNSKDAGVNEQLLQEMSQLKKLIYVSLASCGLMLAAVAGIWLKNTNRLAYKKIIAHYLSKH